MPLLAYMDVGKGRKQDAEASPVCTGTMYRKFKYRERPWMAEATVLSGERGAKADAYMEVGVRATQDAKAEKRKISESSGRLFLAGQKKYPQGINTLRLDRLMLKKGLNFKGAKHYSD